MMISSHDNLASAWQSALAQNSALTTLLFDLDGTLVNTMALHYEAYAHVFKQHGGHLQRSDFNRLVGPPAALTIPQFAQAAGIAAPDVKALHLQKKDAFEKILADTQLELLPAGHLLLEVKDDFQIAVVTSGNTKGASAILKTTNLWPHVELLITGDDVTRGKPAPEPYQLALDRLNKPSKAGLVFEDHKNGLDSARLAGLSAIDVETYSFINIQPPA